MKTILVYSPEEAKRNSFVVKKFREQLGAELVDLTARVQALRIITAKWTQKSLTVRIFAELQTIRK